MFLKNYRKIIKTALLMSTTFIAPLQNSFGAEHQNESDPANTVASKEPSIQYVKKENQTDLVASCTPPIHYIRAERIQAALITFSEIIKFDKNIPKNKDLAIAYKKEWIKKAFSNLKEMTDIIRSTKYIDKFTIPRFEKNLSSIEGWDPTTESFDQDVFFFQLSSKDSIQKLTLSTLDTKSIQKIIDSLVLRLSKKAMFLEKFQQMGQYFYNLEKDKIYERNSVICLLFAKRFDNKKIKSDFTHYVNALLFKNKKQEEPFGSYKVKLLYTQTKIQEKHSEIKSKMESIWSTYIKGLEILSNEKNTQNKDFYRINIFSKTLPTAMEGLLTEDIRDYLCYLINRNKTLEEIYEHYYNGSFIPITNASREYTQPKPYTLTIDNDLLAKGKSLIENIDKHTFNDKITWIANALSMIKLYENDIDKILFDTYLTNPVYTYPSWDDHAQFYTIDPNFKIGLSFPDKEEPTYVDLLNLDETYIDSCIIPVLLKQSYQRHCEYMSWMQRGTVTKKTSRTLNKKTKTTLSPAELSWEITHYAPKNQILMNQIDVLIKGFTEDTFNYDAYLKNDPNLQSPELILLQKSPSQEYVSCFNLITDIYQKWSGFNAKLGPLNFNCREDIQKKNLDITQQQFLDNMKPVLAKYTDQDLQLAADSLKHQFAMFTKINQIICLKIEDKCQPCKTDAKLPAQGKLRHKHKQKQNTIVFPKTVQSPPVNSSQASEKLDEAVAYIQGNSTKSHKNKPLPRKGNRYPEKGFEMKNDLKSENETKQRKVAEEKGAIQLVPMNGRYGVVGKSHPLEPRKKLINIPQQPMTPDPLQTTQPIFELIQDTVFVMPEPVEQIVQTESPQQEQPLPSVEPLQKAVLIVSETMEPIVQPKSSPQEQPLPTVEPVIETVESVVPTKIEPESTPTPIVKKLEKSRRQNKSTWKPQAKAMEVKAIEARPIEAKPIEKIKDKTESPFMSKETMETSTLPSSGTEAPITIQQINYLLAHNPSWNGYLYTPDTKVIIPNENVKEIIIQTGTINLHGQNNVAVHVYHHYPEKK